LKYEDQNISLSIRAANAISVLDSMSQDRRIESHIRTMLWQVVSNLEGIRDNITRKMDLEIVVVVRPFQYLYC
jgi:hypothetical protein